MNPQSAQRVWNVARCWVAPVTGFAAATAALLATGRQSWASLVADLALALPVGYALAAALLSCKALIGGYSADLYRAELRNFLMPGAHCFAWTTAHIVQWAVVLLIWKWCGFWLVAEWAGHNPLHPRAGGLDGALTGAAVGAAFGLLSATYAAVRGTAE